MRTLPVGAAFGHMLRSTTNNLGFAWQLSWPWILLIAPANILATLYGFTLEPRADGSVPEGKVIAIALLVAALTLFAFASIAVSWHRYVLLDEVPRGWARLRADNTVWRYFGNTLLIMLVLVAGMVPAVLLAAIPLAMGDAGAILAVPIYFATVIYGIAAFYRLSVKLPAVALERYDFGLKDAWSITQGNTWRLFGLALLFALCVLVIALLLAGVVYLLEKTGLTFALMLGLSLQIVFNWIFTIMGVTLLTSLYGFFVEKREF